MSSETENQELNSAETVRGLTGGQRVLGRYQLVRVLGQGGMGIVWLARDEELEREVALKFLPDIVVNDRASLADLKRETRRSLELTHPNIVRTYDFVQDSTTAGISMEYVDSDTLRNLRIDQPNGVFQPAQLGEWMKQLCSALDYAHTQAAIVHRDLKPANLMVNGRGQLKVADFGIARSLVESVSVMSMRGGVSGTLVYMSPQQLSGEPASPGDDIYATGVTLYELLTTRPPFYTGDISGQVHTKVPPSLAERRAALNVPAGDLPQSWERTIAACLAKDPAYRPRSAAEIAVGLGLAEAASISQSTAVHPVAPPPLPGPGAAPAFPMSSGPVTLPMQTAQSSPTSRKVWPLAVGMAAVAVALVAGGIIWISGGSKSGDNHRSVGDSAKTPVETTAHPVAAAAPVSAAPAYGSLYIATDPPGAAVTVGNMPPEKSPAAFEEVPAGSQSVKVSLDGFDPIFTTTEIEPGKLNKCTPIALVRSKGPLHIVSTPAGLPVEVKQKAKPLMFTKSVTPFDATEMPAGDYDVTVTREGWPAQRRVVKVTKGVDEPNVFEFPGGGLLIKSTPPGAKVLADGKELGKTPLTLADELPPGEAKYTLRLPGYDDVTVTGTIQPGATQTVEQQLSKTTASKPRVVTTTTTPVRPRARDYDDDRPRAGEETLGSRAKKAAVDGAIRGFFNRGF